jgi:uncharacterized protein YyaL (SSP411 family)
MAKTPLRRWRGWLLNALAVVGAGVLSGWILGEHGEQDAQTDKPRENRLANESSPYLQLHKHNPINWYPWGAEAFEKAKREGKVIFLSIGYTSCHWCHVMERESFNDLEIAKTLNQHFVCIKVDREELPDVDEAYMNAMLVSRRSGGWPLTMFLTPDRKPFHGATYLTPRSRDGIDGLAEVLLKVIALWSKNRAEVEQTADEWERAVKQYSTVRGFSFRKLDRAVIDQGVEQVANIFDREHGGFGYDPRNPRRPKFPQPSILRLLLYQARQSKDENAQAMAKLTLDRMARGGIWDLLGGGFHRYSTDRLWQVPHFEKMLYDNAQLASVYLEAAESTGDRNYRNVARWIFEFVEREMTSKEDGGFYSAIDADSEEEEGKYYAWTAEEMKAVLSPREFEVFGGVNGVRDREPNFDGRYVLQPVAPLPEIANRLRISMGDLAGQLEPAAQKLIAARNERTRPITDTKIMTDWNGLMIAALADGSRILQKAAYLQSAERAADLILTKLRDRDGRLLHVYTAGTAKLPAFLEDYAFLLEGLLALHRTTGDARWLNEARRVADQMIEYCWDESSGGFYRTALDQDVPLVRTKPFDDKAIPSGNGVAVRALVELARRSGERRYAETAAKTMAAFAGPLATSPGESPYMTIALGEYLDAGFPSSSLVARPPTRDPEVVRSAAKISRDKLQPGQPFQITVTLKLDANWHIYANPASRPEYVPTTIKVTGDLPLEDVEIQYPRASQFRTEGIAESIDVYSDAVEIKVNAKLGAAAEIGNAELKLAVRYQACNDHECLAPKTVQLIVPVVVAPPGEAIRRVSPVRNN